MVHEGYELFALRTVAEFCAVKLGNLQYYFPTREALLEEVNAAEAQRDLTTLRHQMGNG